MDETVNLELLVKGLEKIDSKLNEFSANSTFVQNINITYDGTKKYADLDKEVYQFNNSLKISSNESWGDVSTSLSNIVESGVKHNYDKVLEQIVYKGIRDKYGITNNLSVKVKNITKWNSKDGNEILKDINEAITDLIENRKSIVKNIEIRILLPYVQYVYMATKIIEEKSILSYVSENNIAKKKNIKFGINPCRHCTGIAPSDEDRMVIYIKEAVSINIPQKLTRIRTKINKEEKTYSTIYGALIGHVNFENIDAIRYCDGI